MYSTWEPCPLCAGAITVAFRGRITVGYACRDPISSGLRVLTDTDIGRRRQWQVQQLRGPFAVFAQLLLACTPPRRVRGASPLCATTSYPGDGSSRPPAPSSPGGETAEQVVATIWAAIEPAEVDTASDASSKVR